MRFASSCLLVFALAAVPAPQKTFDFSSETVGAEPKTMTPVVGVWVVAQDGENKVLMVDGSRWKQGQPAANLADKARALYGDRYAEFLHNVHSFAYFPYAVAKEIDDFREGEIRMRFKPLAGRIVQGAGILFNLKRNGDYLIVRANALENNLVLFQFVRGKRSPVKWIRNTPTATQKWHDLKLEVSGTSVKGYLDGKLYLEHTLDSPVAGRVGVWSKADSFVYFDDFQVRPKS